VQLVSEISNLCDHKSPTSQTDGQTDRRTTCDPKTAHMHLSALRGKNKHKIQKLKQTTYSKVENRIILKKTRRYKVIAAAAVVYFHIYVNINDTVNLVTLILVFVENSRNVTNRWGVFSTDFEGYMTICSSFGAFRTCAF